MRSDEAAFEAFDGVELRLLNGAVVRCDPLTVAEAVRYLRLFAQAAEALKSGEGDLTPLDTLTREFPARVGLTDQRLADLGITLDGVEFGDLTLADALAMIDLLALALADPYAVESSKAKVRVLDEFPATLGVEGLDASGVFALARSFAEAVYRSIYRFAQDFLPAQAGSPPARAWAVRATASPRASTT